MLPIQGAFLGLKTSLLEEHLRVRGVAKYSSRQKGLANKTNYGKDFSATDENLIIVRAGTWLSRLQWAATCARGLRCITARQDRAAGSLAAVRSAAATAEANCAAISAEVRQSLAENCMIRTL